MDFIKFREKKKKVVVFCSLPRQNVKFGTTAKKCIKKDDARAKLLFC